MALSLGTRRYSEAEHLAEELDLIYSGKYSSAVSAVTSPADLRGILRAYLEDALEDDTTMRLNARPGRPVYGGLVYEERDVVDRDLQTVAMCLSDAREALAERNFNSVHSNVSRLMEGHGLPGEHPQQPRLWGASRSSSARAWASPR